MLEVYSEGTNTLLLQEGIENCVYFCVCIQGQISLKCLMQSWFLDSILIKSYFY